MFFDIDEAFHVQQPADSQIWMCCYVFPTSFTVDKDNLDS